MNGTAVAASAGARDSNARGPDASNVIVIAYPAVTVREELPIVSCAVSGGKDENVHGVLSSSLMSLLLSSLCVRDAQEMNVLDIIHPRLIPFRFLKLVKV